MSTLPVPDVPADLETTAPPEAWHQQPSRILAATELASLNVKSDRQGSLQFLSHLAVLAISGALWGTQIATSSPNWLVALPALVIYGFGLAAMFAPLHECVHRTAFASQPLNDRVAWLAGVLSLYNSTFYRRYHKWHHRYTRMPGQDPELSDPAPRNIREYLLELSGIPWWIGKIRGHFRIAAGRLEDCPYIPAAAREEVIRSTRWQLLVYGIAMAISLAFQQPWFIEYWLLPLAVGQPILRFILLAEHTGCAWGDQPLQNTRTTLTLWPLRVLMWNMGFHAEHHLYASIPFHALPAAHQRLSPHFNHVDRGYIQVNAQLISQLGQL
jgi:fatty acid desaturase